MMANTRYIVAGAKPWNQRIFEETISAYPGTWRFVSRPEELTLANVQSFDPRYLFFLHWSWKIAAEITSNYECVCFHMTDVPYGRGGSPLQNLIVRGFQHTKLTALQMVEDFDAGPVYLKEDLCLEGTAEQIYIRASRLSTDMIRRIIEEQPQPQAQVGEPTIFKRRQPHESRIPSLPSLEALYDFIRMLDADGYPHAFFEYGGFRYELSGACLYDGRIDAQVTIKRAEPSSNS